MSKAGKKYQEAAKLVEAGKLYTAAEAMELVKKTATKKFDETIELHVRLGVDPKYADQQVRGAMVLPHGTGKSKPSSSLQKARKSRRQRLQVQTSLAPMKSSRRSRVAGSTSMSLSLRRI